MRTGLIMAMVAATAALATTAGAAEKAGAASATIVDSKGKTIGTATFIEKGKGVEISVAVSSLPPGKHGMHIHEKGTCEPPGFSTAGGHFNPFSKRHGVKNPEGKHAGDMPNLEVGKDGSARTTAMLENTTLRQGPASLLKEGGTALLIHADPDDEKTDPAGNAGARIACGVIKQSR